jgi:hypothetical protein
MKRNIELEEIKSKREGKIDLIEFGISQYISSNNVQCKSSRPIGQ